VRVTLEIVSTAWNERIVLHKIEFEEAFIVGMALDLNSIGVQFVEKVRLIYRRITWTHVVLDRETMRPQGQIVENWDLARGD